MLFRSEAPTTITRAGFSRTSSVDTAADNADDGVASTALRPRPPAIPATSCSATLPSPTTYTVDDPAGNANPDSAIV